MKKIDIALAVIVAALWGFSFVPVRLGLSEFPPLMFSALRFLSAVFPLVFFIRKPNVPWPMVFGIGLFLGVGTFPLLFLGIKLGVPAGIASLLIQTQVLFTVVMAAIILRETIRPMQIIGILIACGGMGLIVLTLDARFTVTGFVLVLAAALCWASSNVLMKKAGNSDMLALIVYASLAAPIPVLLMSVYFEGWSADVAAFSHVTWVGVVSVLYNGLIATVICFFVWGRLIKQYGVGQIAPFALLVPVFGMSSAALFLGEAFGPIRLAAAVLVISGLVLTVLRFSRPVIPAT